MTAERAGSGRAERWAERGARGMERRKADVLLIHAQRQVTECAVWVEDAVEGVGEGARHCTGHGGECRSSGSGERNCLTTVGERWRERWAAIACRARRRTLLQGQGV